MKQNIIAFEVQEDCTLDYTNFEGGETIEIPLDDCPNDWKGIEWFEKYPQIFKPVYASPSTPVDEVKDKHTESKQPLYKVLNEKMQQKEFLVVNNLVYSLHETGRWVKGEREVCNRMSISVQPDYGRNVTEEEAKATAQYTAIALNNLASLAEALEACKNELYSIHSQYGDKQHALDNCNALLKAEQALTRIS